MTDKELRKLKRQKLLEMMLYQSRELLEKNRQIEELTRSCEEAQETLARLKKRLEEKDAEIAALARSVLQGEEASALTVSGKTIRMEAFLEAFKKTVQLVAAEKQPEAAAEEQADGGGEEQSGGDGND